MDLGAYAQIEDISKIAKDNNIDCPRLRGYRLMSQEEPVNIKDMYNGIDVYCVENLCVSKPFWNYNSNVSCFDLETDYYIKKYIGGKDDHKYVRWNKIHGWKRKVLKTYIHKCKMRIKRQYDIWNKYVGRKDILYIHARIGGGNWFYYYKEVVDKPWFIEKVDDNFDSTYCDIYARIKPVECNIIDDEINR